MQALTRRTLKAVQILRWGIRHVSELPDPNKPVKFTTSEASKWQAMLTRQGSDVKGEVPEAQTYVVCFSLTAFLFYFLYYREESDIDEQFDIFRPIYDRVDDLEEVQLIRYRQYQLKKGEDVSDIDKRIKELEEIRLQKEKEAAAGKHEK